jgi:hypothetical protein
MKTTNQQIERARKFLGPARDVPKLKSKDPRIKVKIGFGFGAVL